MAYYCGECIVWRGSSDENKYGERWCSFSRRYERSDQNTYGCKGFLYAGRAVLTKVCEILRLDTQEWFEAFDKVKEAYLVPQHMGMLVSYCGIGPMLAEKMEQDSKRAQVAQELLMGYFQSAQQMAKKGQYCCAAEKYCEAIHYLYKKYMVE